jgi:hypothetical protein
MCSDIEQLDVDIKDLGATIVSEGPASCQRCGNYWPYIKAIEPTETICLSPKRKLNEYIFP